MLSEAGAAHTGAASSISHDSLLFLILGFVGVSAGRALESEGLAFGEAVGFAGLRSGLRGPMGLPRLSLGGLLGHYCN